MSTHPRSSVALVILLAFVAIGSASLVVGEDDTPTAIRVGSMNLSRILGESGGMTRLQQEIDALYGAKVRALTAQQSRLEARIRAAESGGGGDPRQLRAELTGVLGEIQRVNAQIDRRKLDYLKEFMAELETVSRSVCEEKRVDLLLSRTDLDLGLAKTSGTVAKAMGDRKVWFASPQVLDLTDVIVARLAED